MARNFVRLIVVMGALCSAAAAQAQGSCEALLSAFEVARKSGEFTAIMKTGVPARSGLVCPVEQRGNIDRMIAVAHVAEAQRLAKQGAPATERLALLQSGRQYGKPWFLLALLGDTALDANGTSNNVLACEAYQAAIDAVTDLRQTPVAPAQDQIERLYRRADQARALASCPMGTGRPLEASAIPIPVQFVYNSDQFNELGKSYAKDAARILEDLKRPKIKVVGHTDLTGGDASNDALSLRRAQAFKGYLVSAGYDGNLISVKGLGKRRPPEIEDRTRYNKDEIDQMLRRVEICFLDRPNTSENCQ
jgi:outer membrane protein OmpA-like peptidoglycan-associated protein